MFGFEFDDTVLMAQSNVLERALSTNPDTRKALQELIRKVIKEARDRAVANIRFKSDPRNAKQSVRRTVYKKILGANINIYNSRKAGTPTSYEPPRKGSTGRGGNRRSRSQRTKDIMGYGPTKRGFILRWLNDGVDNRAIKFKTNEKRKVDRWNSHPNTGNRGSIASKNFFRNATEKELVQAADELANLIDTELDNIMNKKQ